MTSAVSIFDFPHCGRPDCPCAHEIPCRAGWIDTVVTANDRITEGAAPCPVCRPARLPADEELADPRYGRARWFHRLRGTNSRTIANQSDEDW